ncbi:MAG TPA: dTDP-4-dehydrorhamnose reductase [Solirubrobacteraceae bacterium]|jgi:dTDP-4-dehydrorhamnose reductase|nr:dTDP-4-dehydrorhamnose reductase [Solirubrobacteraceae bacterium]
MRILITGAAGMLGLDLAAIAPAGTAALSRAELDITDADAVGAACVRVRPEVVINCAAWTDVDGAEDAYDDALAVNGAGAGVVAGAAAAAGAWTIHVSSDYVFDGHKQSPYVESDPVGPLSAYGRSKLAGEQAVAAAAPDAHTIVRSSWLFGAGGLCFPKTILRLASERAVLRVVDDQIGCPTYTGHLAGALLKLAGRRVCGVVHVAGGGSCSWFEFATAIVAAAGSQCTVERCSTDEFPRPARRPANSVLRSELGDRVPALPSWQEGLSAFMSSGVVTV